MIFSVRIALSLPPHNRVLTANPIECGCCSVWLYEFLNRKNLLGPDCATPSNLKGTPILQLEMDQFCGEKYLVEYLILK